MCQNFPQTRRIFVFALSSVRFHYARKNWSSGYSHHLGDKQIITNTSYHAERFWQTITNYIYFCSLLIANSMLWNIANIKPITWKTSLPIRQCAKFNWLYLQLTKDIIPDLVTVFVLKSRRILVSYAIDIGEWFNRMQKPSEPEARTGYSSGVEYGL
jgi:hypothetical protein